jgi:hypothetical protein
MTPNIAAAMIKIAQAVPQLGKADRNQFAKYNYVSIDKYYEGIAKLAAANGIMWQPREIHTAIEKDVGKDGALRITYAFDLYHESGDAIEEFSKFTILHPIQGAQTAGSALSYADKLFMRSAFKVVTGEQDADASDPDDLKIKERVKQDPAAKEVLKAFPDAQVVDVRPKGANALEGAEAEVTDRIDDDGFNIFKSDATDFNTIAKICVRIAPTAESESDLMRFWTVNMGVIDRMKNEAPKLYAKVKEEFTKRRAALKKG